jgi:hypothetical protein
MQDKGHDHLVVNQKENTQGILQKAQVEEVFEWHLVKQKA